ncbi:Serine/threonine-protein kinase-like protein [Striga hermonthica]|uniref:Serine/threonine-protein kinase-like protein n=1 Tax=Striga hermonthica TaxID=68872 RepID=A0A9N7MZJ7_STRHE|nr:Serine/threonine-protein kinase-like protein [Striga hermonthica]
MGYLSCKAESSISIVDSGKERPVKIQQFSYSDLELATANFSHSRLLGRGSHGLVYKGLLRGGRPVAVKKPSQKTQSPSEFDNEIDILSRLHSPRFVNLVGFSRPDPTRADRLLVVEFMSNGTLYDALHSSPRPPSWGRRIRLALQTARAVHTLHYQSPPVIHRDIKSANVLIDRRFSARLGDFGLALRCGDGSRLKSTPPAGTMGYLDPGYVTPDSLSTKTDGIYDEGFSASTEERCVNASTAKGGSWSDFAVNPCLAVEDVGQPAKSRGGDDEGRVGKVARNPRRVYSDLGIRSNLMDLMSAGPNGGPEFSMVPAGGV